MEWWFVKIYLWFKFIFKIRICLICKSTINNNSLHHTASNYLHWSWNNCKDIMFKPFFNIAVIDQQLIFVKMMGKFGAIAPAPKLIITTLWRITFPANCTMPLFNRNRVSFRVVYVSIPFSAFLNRCFMYQLQVSPHCHHFERLVFSH